MSRRPPIYSLARRSLSLSAGHFYRREQTQGRHGRRAAAALPPGARLGKQFSEYAVAIRMQRLQRIIVRRPLPLGGSDFFFDALQALQQALTPGLPIAPAVQEPLADL